VKNITPDQAKQLPNTVVFLDVRTPGEFTEGHIVGAINVDYYEDDFAEQIAQLDKSKTYAIYCRTGVRSANAMRIMYDKGFHKIYNILGGTYAWAASGYELSHEKAQS